MTAYIFSINGLAFAGLLVLQGIATSIGIARFPTPLSHSGANLAAV